MVFLDLSNSFTVSHVNVESLRPVSQKMMRRNSYQNVQQPHEFVPAVSAI